MLEGRCPKCGTYRVGWALCFPRYQMCPECGEGLEITENGRPVSKGYSPFTAERYFIDVPTSTPSSHDEAKDSRGQKKKQHT